MMKYRDAILAGVVIFFVWFGVGIALPDVDVFDAFQVASVIGLCACLAFVIFIFGNTHFEEKPYNKR